MDALETKLYNFMYENGVDAKTASDDAANCARSVGRTAIAGGAIGGVAGLITKNPATLLMAGVGGAAGGGLAVLASPSCHEVRAAADHWVNRKLSF